MDAVLTVRLNRDVKERVTAILKQDGLSPSSAVQELFDYILRTGDIPFKSKGGPSEQEIQKRLLAFAGFQLEQPLQLTDEQVKQARIKDRYDIDVG
jgi:RHH-type rel operon transcriptional repressor/antitoxin RelB